MPIKFDTILARLRQKDITASILAALNIWQKVGTLISPKTANDTLEVKSTTAGSIAANFEGEFVGVHGVGTGTEGFGVVGYGHETGVLGGNLSTDPTACKPAITARTNSANITKADIVAGFGTLYRWMLAWKGWTDPQLSEKEAGNIAVIWSDPTIGQETSKFEFWLRKLDVLTKVASLDANGNIDITSINSQSPFGIWTVITGAYASTSTFTFTGTDKDVNLIQHSLFTCTDSAGTTRRIGYVKSAVNNSGTITATVVTDSNLASGDKDFKVAYNRKINDYQHLISIPGECIADTSYSQGVWMQNIMVDSYLLPADFSVLTAAAGTGAALTINIYKNTTNLFSSAPDLATNTVLLAQRPTTKEISAGENISLRIMSSAGATNKAADFQARLFVIPQLLFSAF